MSSFYLTLDSKLHIYNPKYKTFHISMEHLFGWDSEVVGRTKLMAGTSTPIQVTNESTGTTVTFHFLDAFYDSNYHSYDSAKRCRYYTGIDDKTSAQYKLILWADMDTLRKHYTAKRDMFSLVSGLHEIVNFPIINMDTQLQ